MPTFLLLKGKRPYERMVKLRLMTIHCWVFGCLCFVSTLQQGRELFHPRAKPYVFVGFGKKGYKGDGYWKRTLPRDVVFHEEIFPWFPITAEHTSDDSHEINSPNETLSAQDERLFFNLQNCSASKTILTIS